MKIRCIVGYFNNWSRKSKAQRCKYYFVRQLFIFRMIYVIRNHNNCLTKAQHPSNVIKVAFWGINNGKFETKSPPTVTIITAGGLRKTYFNKKTYFLDTTILSYCCSALISVYFGASIISINARSTGPSPIGSFSCVGRL